MQMIAFGSNKRTIGISTYSKVFADTYLSNQPQLYNSFYKTLCASIQVQIWLLLVGSEVRNSFEDNFLCTNYLSQFGLRLISLKQVRDLNPQYHDQNRRANHLGFTTQILRLCVDLYFRLLFAVVLRHPRPQPRHRAQLELRVLPRHRRHQLCFSIQNPF